MILRIQKDKKTGSETLLQNPIVDGGPQWECYGQSLTSATRDAEAAQWIQWIQGATTAGADQAKKNG